MRSHRLVHTRALVKGTGKKGGGRVATTKACNMRLVPVQSLVPETRSLGRPYTRGENYNLRREVKGVGGGGEGGGKRERVSRGTTCWSPREAFLTQFRSSHEGILPLGLVARMSLVLCAGLTENLASLRIIRVVSQERCTILIAYLISRKFTYDSSLSRSFFSGW